MSNSYSYRQFEREVGACSASRHLIHVPKPDWAQVRAGVKDEFRGGGSISGLEEGPLPVALFANVGSGSYEVRMFVLLEAWREPLGAISALSLEAEGHDTLAEFREWWVARREPFFNVLKKVTVYRVRPWEPQDSDEMARALLDRLYPPDRFSR